MALSRTDRERLTLVIAALEAEAKEAAEQARVSRSRSEFHWQQQCSQAADTLRELIARKSQSPNGDPKPTGKQA